MHGASCMEKNRNGYMRPSKPVPKPGYLQMNKGTNSAKLLSNSMSGILPCLFRYGTMRSNSGAVCPPAEVFFISARMEILNPAPLSRLQIPT